MLLHCFAAAGFFSAKANSLVKLPWQITGACPAAGKKVITNIVTLSQTAGSTACSKALGTPKPLQGAAAGEVARAERCMGNKGYTVFRANTLNGQPAAGQCYLLRAILSDGMSMTGTLQVLAR
jgi:hypothetical protein